MPRCYMLACCEKSILDADLNALSLIHLVESVGLRAPIEQTGIIDLEIHSYWQQEPQDLGETYEIRYVSCSKDGERSNSPLQFSSIYRHYRLRSSGLLVFSVGDRELRVEWRRQGADDPTWNREPLFWPLNISEQSSNELSE